jgi:hypothetical protein
MSSVAPMLVHLVVDLQHSLMLLETKEGKLITGKKIVCCLDNETPVTSSGETNFYCPKCFEKHQWRKSCMGYAREQLSKSKQLREYPTWKC